MEKKILHVVNIFFTIPYFLGEQLLYFNSKGYKEHIICSPSEELRKYAEYAKFNYIEIDINRKISIKDDIKAIIKTYKYIKKNNIDIVVGHTPKGALIAIIAGRLAGIKKRIYFRHGLVFETAKGLKKFILKTIDRLTAYLSTKVVNVSPSVARISLQEKLNFSKKQIVLNKGTCNGINITKFNKYKLDCNKVKFIRYKLNINADNFIIGYTGRLVKDKGIIELVESFKILKEKYKFKKIKLLLVGMLEERDALPKKIIEEIKSNEDIIHTNYISYDEIEYYYSSMDIFILPSYREGFPTSVLEASAMELPVLTTKATGCIDSIIENKTGLFIEHSADSIVDKVSKFIENPNYKKEIGNNGRIFVKENFEDKIVWKEIEKLYI